MVSGQWSVVPAFEPFPNIKEQLSAHLFPLLCRIVCLSCRRRLERLRVKNIGRSELCRYNECPARTTRTTVDTQVGPHRARYLGRPLGFFSSPKPLYACARDWWRLPGNRSWQTWGLHALPITAMLELRCGASHAMHPPALTPCVLPLLHCLCASGSTLSCSAYDSFAIGVNFAGIFGVSAFLTVLGLVLASVCTAGKGSTSLSTFTFMIICPSASPWTHLVLMPLVTATSCYS